MIEIQENAEFEVNALVVMPKPTSDQLQGLLRKHPTSNGKEKFNKGISTSLFSRIRAGKIQVTLAKVYTYDANNLPRKIAGNHIGPFLARLYSMNIIQCDKKGFLSFTKEAENLFEVLKKQN